MANLQDPLRPLPALPDDAGRTKGKIAPGGKTARRQGRRRWTAVLGLCLAFGLLVGVSEATGLTRISATVIRLAFGEGTLVIESHDPNLTIAVDGEDVRIRGARIRELKLRPGEYLVNACKDGRPVRQEIVSIERNGKTTLNIALDPSEKVESQAGEPTDPNLSNIPKPEDGSTIPAGSSADVFTSDAYRWTTPEAIGPEVTNLALHPFLTKDGSTLFFTMRDPESGPILLLMDCGGSNSFRSKMFKYHLSEMSMQGLKLKTRK